MEEHFATNEEACRFDPDRGLHPSGFDPRLGRNLLGRDTRSERVNLRIGFSRDDKVSFPQ